MKVAIVFFTLFLSGFCYSQPPLKMNSEAKKMLRKYKVEGWHTIDEGCNLEEQFATWYQLSNFSNNRYRIAFSEKENADLEIATKLAWMSACDFIHSEEKTNVSSLVTREDSVVTQFTGSVVTSANLTINRRTNTDYKMKSQDLQTVFSVYRKVPNGYKVQMVVVKEKK